MKKWIVFCLVCLLMMTGAGCTMIEPKVDLQNVAVVAPVYPESVGFDEHEEKRAVFKANPVSDEFRDALNDFAYETVAQIKGDPEENLLYSPISLYYATALATMGAKGETQEELLHVLGVTDLETLASQCGNLFRALYTDHEIAQLRIANSVWMDRELNGQAVSFKENYIKSAEEDFYASIFDVDFSNPETGEMIGQWIDEQTKGTLDYEYNPDPEQIMSIINTIYFYDEWTDRFNADKTEEDEFFLANGETVRCDFMNSRYMSHGFVKGDGFTRSTLGLKAAGSMIFILPDEGVSVQELISTPERIQSILSEGERQSGEVIWQVPKFSYGTSMKLIDMMKALGVNRAFETDADFSGMVDGIAFISEIQQNTHIAIDENGVEASAYTEIQMVGCAMPEGKAEMILDRPFIYGIQSRYGDLLFVGVCSNPTLK